MKRQSHCLLTLLFVCEANNVIFSMTLTFVEIHLKIQLNNEWLIVWFDS